MDDIFEWFKAALADHWPFFAIAFILGQIGAIAKKRVWTKERAALPGRKGRFFWWSRALLPIHAPAAGTLLGVVGYNALGDALPISPGIVGAGNVVLYYAAAGAVSAWFYNILRHIAKSRGLKDGPDDTSMPFDPPSSRSNSNSVELDDTEPPPAA